jgi:hypothetical protein
MGEPIRNRFVVRHYPMSLGDAIAALFRPKPKRPASAIAPSGFRPSFQRAPSPLQQLPAMELAEKSHSSVGE